MIRIPMNEGSGEPPENKVPDAPLPTQIEVKVVLSANTVRSEGYGVGEHRLK